MSPGDFTHPDFHPDLVFPDLKENENQKDEKEHDFINDQNDNGHKIPHDDEEMAKHEDFPEGKHDEDDGKVIDIVITHNEDDGKES
jgi:hypothetical protein